MKELSNEEIKELAELIGNHSSYELARLVGGDLSHIGRGILEGRKLRVRGSSYALGVYFDYSRCAGLYELEPIPVKAMHYGDQVIEGFVETVEVGSDYLTIKFKDVGFRNTFANKLQKKEIK